LAGVLFKNKPIIGCITSPFYNYEEGKEKCADSISYFNIPSLGIFELKKLQSQFIDNQDNYKISHLKHSKKSLLENENENVKTDLRLIVSRTREEKLKQILSPLVTNNIIKNLQIKTDNGMGYRSIKMIEHGYYYMTVKSNLGFWDLCATDAIFREIGGGCINLKGKEINYSPADTKIVFPYDIIIGDDKTSINYYVKHCKKVYN